MFISVMGFLGGSAGKESTYNAGDLGSIPGLGRSPGEGKVYPLQYSGLENFIDCIVHGVTKSGIRLSAFHFSFCYIHSILSFLLLNSFCPLSPSSFLSYFIASWFVPARKVGHLALETEQDILHLHRAVWSGIWTWEKIQGEAMSTGEMGVHTTCGQE